MSKLARYGIANVILVVCLMAFYESDESLWFTVAIAAGAFLVVNLLVAYLGSKGDPRRV